MMVLHGLAIAALYAAMWAGPAWLRLTVSPTNPGSGLTVSWVFIIARLATSIINLAPDREASALIEEGLSIQNQLQIGVTFAAAAWATYLMLGGGLPARDLLRGPLYWVVFLTITFFASTAWSELPALTLYRSFELLVFVVIATHLFAYAPFESQARVLAISVAGLIWLNGLVFHPDRLFDVEGLFAALRHNQGSMIAAVWICLAVRRLRFPGGPLAWVELIIATLSLFVFGSFASALALVCGLGAMVFAMARGAYRSLAALVLAVLSLASIFLLVSGPLAEPWQWMLTVAGWFGKSEELLVTMSGRIPYWQAVWTVAVEHPYGLGFGAAERFLGLDLNLETLNVITNSHSGYISAWLGAGWLGLALCLTIFATVLSRIGTVAKADRTAIYAAFTILAINNLTVAAVAGPLNPGLLMMIGLAALPVELARPVRTAEISLPTPPP